jgi:hypothetical protein
VIIAVACLPARGDGIDLVSYFTRVGSERSAAGILGMVVLLMAVNYILNALVIGLPAIKAGPSDWRSVGAGLVTLTLLGQVADRLGALPAVLLAGLLAWAFDLTELGTFASLLLGLNFVLSGIAVGALAFFFLTRRWHVETRTAQVISASAGVLTNPAWAMGLWLLE